MTISDSPPRPAASPLPYRSLAIACLGVGAFLLFASACAVLTFVVSPLLQTSNALATNTAVLSIAALTVGYGALLLIVGRALRRNTLAGPLHLPSPLVFGGAFFFILLVGQLVLALNVGAAYLFPVWHVLASLCVPLIVLSFCARRLGPVSVRSMLAQFSWGGLVTISLALLFELIVGGILVVAALVAIAVVVGADRMTELAEALPDAATDPQRVITLIAQEPLALLIGALTALILFVIVVPLIEEILKGAGPALLIARRVRTAMLPTRSQVLLWGLAAGAGYAFSENMFNATGSLNANAGLTSFWAAAMLLRGGTSLMHMLATGTVAAGWYYALVEHKPSRFVLLLAAATCAHGLWNIGALALGGMSALTGPNENYTVAAAVIVALALLFLGALFVGFLVWLRALLRWAQPASVQILFPSGAQL